MRRRQQGRSKTALAELDLDTDSAPLRHDFDNCGASCDHGEASRAPMQASDHSPRSLWSAAVSFSASVTAERSSAARCSLSEIGAPSVPTAHAA